MKTVVVGGESMDLLVPQSLWIRHAVQLSIGETTSLQTRAQVAAAALFLCSQHGKAGAPGAPRYEHDVAAYGAAVLEYLLQRGVPQGDIFAGGAEALELILASIPRPADEAAAEGNSAAPSGA